MARSMRVDRLWRWAARCRPKDAAGGGRRQLERRLVEAHLETMAFVDAVHAASKVLRYILPVARSLAHLRHNIRGTQMPAELDNVQMLSEWNTATEFLEGAEAAHEALLEARWRPAGEPLHSGLREATSADVRAYLDQIRQADGDQPADSTGSTSGREAKVVAVSTRFEHLHGPPSLEMIRSMDAQSLFKLRQDHARMSAFHDDTFKGSTLHLRLAAVAEVELPACAERPEELRPLTLRRVDRLHLACDFNLREGIASAFRVDQLEPLVAETCRPGPLGFAGEDAEHVE